MTFPENELELLLHAAYVDGGFTDPVVAERVFEARAVQARGEVLLHRDAASGALLGMVILVSPGTPACRIADSDEAELQLLAVAAAHRGQGIGRQLVEHAMRAARARGIRSLVLWTQPTMHAAQHLYRSVGFARASHRDFERNGRAFLVFERTL